MDKTEKDLAGHAVAFAIGGIVLTIILGAALPKYPFLADGYCLLDPRTDPPDMGITYPWACMPGWLLLLLAAGIAFPFFIAMRAYGSFKHDETVGFSVASMAPVVVLGGIGFVTWILNGILPPGQAEEASLGNFLGDILGTFVSIIVVFPIWQLFIITYFIILFGMLTFIGLNLPLVYSYFFTTHPAESDVRRSLGDPQPDTGGARSGSIASKLGLEPESEAHAYGLRRQAKSMKESAEMTLDRLREEEAALSKQVELSTELKKDEAELARLLAEIERKKIQIRELKKEV